MEKNHRIPQIRRDPHRSLQFISTFKQYFLESVSCSMKPNKDFTLGHDDCVM